MAEIAVRAERLSKRFAIDSRREPYGTLRDSIVSAVRTPLRALRDRGTRGGAKDFWALRDVSFEIKQGDVLGVIGRNGAGKSTLLKILARVTHPSSGRAEVYGRVGSLLEVGTGFHRELTGRENVYLSGAILGMKKAEIDRKFDAIVDFAEIEPFLDMPVKRYSSGMFMRLAFAVAAHLEPEILIVDEVLAVGDAEFQQKCLGKMRGIAKGSGRTVLFVSHNLQAVRALCDRGIFLSHGQVLFDGEVQDAVQHYMDYIREGARKPLQDNPDRAGEGPVRLRQVQTRDERGLPCRDFIAGEPLLFDFEYVRERPCTSLSIGFTVFNRFGSACTHFSTSSLNLKLDAPGDHGHLLCRIPRNPFPVGEYRISIVAHADNELADYIPGCLSFNVISSRFFPAAGPVDDDLMYCPVMVDHEWHHAAGD